MQEAGCNPMLVRGAILARKGAQKVLPFRYTAAARYAPMYEPELDVALQATIQELPKLTGTTAVLVDISGSMNVKLSGKSDLTRMDAAATLAAVINGDTLRMFSFTTQTKEVPPRRGMAGVDAILKSQPYGSTDLAGAVAVVNREVAYDRLIVITDEQSTSYRPVPNPRAGAKGYMINTASYKNGVGYGPWTHIDGFSEKVLHWIHEVEKQE